MKDYAVILSERDYFDRTLYSKYSALEHAKINNQQREQLLAERERVQNLLEDWEKYNFDTKRLISATEAEDREFKNRRIAYLNELITTSLNDIFPDDCLKAKLKCDFNRKNEVSLLLYDADMEELEPDICSGKLQQYLISFTAVAGIALGLGVNNLYVDEAFGVAAPEILGEIGKIVQRYAEKGMQIVLISQNPGLYQDLPRHEIRLHRDPLTKSVEVVSETDY